MAGMKLAKRITALFLSLVTALTLASCSASPSSEHTENPHRSSWSGRTEVRDTTGGSVGDLKGSTVIVTILADDTLYSWDRTDSNDKSRMDTVQEYLNIATDYLTENAAKYGSKVWFTTDFIHNSDLLYTVSFNHIVTNSSTDSYDLDDNAWHFIDRNIDEESIREKYHADNVVYLMVFDTDEDCSAITCTRNWYQNAAYDYEIVYLYYIDMEMVNPPAVYAHEILHTFGAPDLYTPDSDFGIGRDFVNYVGQNMPNEIMYTCSDPLTGSYVYDRVPNEMSELTAYFVGLTDSSEIADEWGFTDPNR